MAQQWLKEVSICMLSYLFEGINIHDWTASYPKLQALFRRKKDKQFVALSLFEGKLRQPKNQIVGFFGVNSAYLTYHVKAGICR